MSLIAGQFQTRKSQFSLPFYRVANVEIINSRSQGYPIWFPGDFKSPGPLYLVVSKLSGFVVIVSAGNVFSLSIIKIVNLQQMMQ